MNANTHIKRIIRTSERSITLSLAIILTMFLLQVNAQPNWSYGTYYSEDTPLNYHLFVPESYDGLESLPIVLHLHGAGGVSISRMHLWSDTTLQKKHPCFVLAPVSNAYWLPVEHNSILELLDSLTHKYNIDTNRIYINGYSMGGYGTWEFIDAKPDYFAAAVPVAGGWNNYFTRINAIKHIPVWNHHGSLDDDVSPILSKLIFDYYESNGLPVVYPGLQKYVKPKIPEHIKQNIITQDIDYIYTEYEGLNHSIWYVTFADTVVFEWLFSKRKRSNGIIELRNNSTYTKINSNQSLKIKCDIDTLDIVLQYSNDLGYNWETLGDYPSNKDSISVNTQQLADSPQGQFRVQLIDKDGNILGTDYSGYYKVDNEGNCVPWLRYYVSFIENKDIQKSTDAS